jgi:hypothetical protein
LLDYDRGVSADFRILRVDDGRVLLLDGVPLDEAVGRYDPAARGLAPAWFDGFDSDAQGRAEWAHVRATADLTSGPQVMPVLVCPDDYDFACAVVVIDVRPGADVVVWERFGWDLTPFAAGAVPAYVGGFVSWFATPHLVFDRREYEKALRLGAGVQVPPVE